MLALDIDTYILQCPASDLMLRLASYLMFRVVLAPQPIREPESVVPDSILQQNAKSNAFDGFTFQHM